MRPPRWRRGSSGKWWWWPPPKGGDADDEEDVCRICPMTGEDNSPLYYPCACSGSVEYVHQECLLEWLNHSYARQCEVHFLRVCG
jgi:E3 ubiquitin-protein ligase MARCH6